MLTKSGAMLLDFGLAKTPEALRTAATITITTEQPVTAVGTVLGTVQYMAPEQIEGRPTDRRSDIFAFGAVLYEMVSGRRAFRGETPTAIVTALLTTNPELLTTTDPTVPAALDHLVRVCLEKDPARRWQSTADIGRQLEWIAADRANARASQPSRRWLTPSSLLWGAAGLAVGAALVALWPRSGSASRGAVVTPARFEIHVPPDSRLLEPPTISRDGKRIVYTVMDKTQSTRLHVRSIDRVESTPIPGTEGGRYPAFSPDGHSIAFLGPGGLKTKSLDGGTPTVIWTSPLQAGLGRGISWGSDATIAFASTPNTGLSRIAAAGGAVQFFTTAAAERDEIGHMWPEQLPDGRGVIFTTTGRGEAEPFKLCLHSPEQPGHRDLVESGRNARYVGGHLIYAVADALMVAAFDVRSLQFTGKPVAALNSVQGVSGIGAALFAVSESGTLVYSEGPTLSQTSTPVWIDATGTSTPLKNVPPGTLHMDATVSPNGEQAVFAVLRGPWQDVWLYDIARSSWTRLTTAAPAEMSPVWLSDRGAIAFSSNAGSIAELYTIPIDGSGDAKLLFRSEHSKYPSSYSPASKLLAYTEFTPTTQTDIWLLDLSGPPKAEAMLTSRFREGAPAFSPDGRWLAYESDESGRFEVFIRPVGPRGAKKLVSADGGIKPKWSPDGRQLFYINDGKLMAVSISPQGETLAIGATTVRAQHAYFGGATANYSVAPDGRVLMVRLDPSPVAPNRLIVVQDWLAGRITYRPSLSKARHHVNATLRLRAHPRQLTKPEALVEPTCA